MPFSLGSEKFVLKGFDEVYNTQNYWVFGLCPSSGILDTRKHNVSETGSVFVLRLVGGDTYSVGSLRKIQPQSLVQ
jgi:hypothetical protein